MENSKICENYKKALDLIDERLKKNTETLLFKIENAEIIKEIITMEDNWKKCCAEEFQRIWRTTDNS